MRLTLLVFAHDHEEKCEKCIFKIWKSENAQMLEQRALGIK